MKHIKIEQYEDFKPQKQVRLNNKNSAIALANDGEVKIEEIENSPIVTLEAACRDISTRLNKAGRKVIIDQNFFKKIFAAGNVPQHFVKRIIEQEEVRISITVSIDTLLETGFSISNITSIFSGFTPTQKHDLVTNIRNFADSSYLIEKLILIFPFKINNISSMLSHSHVFALDTLIDFNKFFANPDNLDSIKVAGFSPSNISSMLNKNGRNIEQILGAIA
jgi:hypothetical protein